MMIKRTLGQKGQVVLPKDVRDYVGIKPGSEVVFEVRGREIVIKPQKSGREFVEDFCNVPKLKGRLSARDMKKLFEGELVERHDIR
ncbi:MAG: AbrB/MazE/SpoVT family DNA-binding domain-containing protein [Candidatus Aenigmarchaeota archaeon]|nr:AbrB/MazE/SpoVT family DNA-binding domain-containing protein [Candidatus Aenigmarchaeota archaeon]